jgi:aerobic carbon-monoxide dehydrogenase small subunit
MSVTLEQARRVGAGVLNEARIRVRKHRAARTVSRIARVTVNINGEAHESEVPARLLLVHYLRDTLGLSGTHVGCDTSNCGACTVLLDGDAVKSCTVLAVQVDGREVTTIEGLRGEDGGLHPLQEAFWEHHGLQCGYCTPGMIMRAADLLARNPSPSEEDVRRSLDGNLCRCTGYHNIVKAVLAAAELMGDTTRGSS